MNLQNNQTEIKANVFFPRD